MKRFTVRKFLNKPGHYTVAAVSARVEVVRGHMNPWSETELTISDCNRAVTLDFDLGDEAARANARFKVDTLMEVLERFSDALYEASDELERAEAEEGS